MERKILSRISILFGGLMLLTGCGKREKSDESSKCVNTTSTSASIASPTIVLSTTTLNYPAITTLVTSTSTYTMSTNLITTSTSQMPYMYSDCVYTTCTVTDSDLEILDSFSKMGNSIRDSFDSGELLDKGKSYFIYCVDFLFYDGEIKGIKFDDLTDSAKEQLLLDITTIDSLICSDVLI